MNARSLYRVPLAKTIFELSLSRAVVVGIANTATDWFLFVALLKSGHFSGTPGVLVASALSYAIGICQSFVLSSHWVYSRGTAVESKRIFPFFVVALFGLGLTTAAVWAFPPILEMGITNSAAALGLSRLSGLGIAFMATFLLNKHFVFRKRQIHDEEA